MNSFHDMRMEKFLAAGIYLVTSESLSNGRSTLDIVKAALEGGIRLVQLREKDMPINSFINLALEVRRLTAGYDALLIINDRPDIAMAVGADGVHLGQEDFPIQNARRLAPDLIIGASTHSTEEAVEAQKAGASYINIGPLFETGTKKWNEDFLGIEGLLDIVASIDIPFTVMGGIKKQHIQGLREAGARTIAVVTAVTAAEDPRGATEELLAAMGETGLS